MLCGGSRYYTTGLIADPEWNPHLACWMDLQALYPLKVGLQMMIELREKQPTTARPKTVMVR